MLNYYQLSQGVGVSTNDYTGLKPIDEAKAKDMDVNVYLLDSLPIDTSQCCGLVQQWSHADGPESLEHFQIKSLPVQPQLYPPWMRAKMENKQCYRVNTSHPRWMTRLSINQKSKKKVHVAGLGDVGGTLLTGLRLLGGGTIESIGIYDLTLAKMQRWEYEGNQIASVSYHLFPPIETLQEDDLFNCDVFVFCIAKHVPELSVKNTDVRMAQLEANGAIIAHYARLARQRNFQGLFAVVSDPVDHLCKVAYQASNINEQGVFDGKGFFPEQVKGYGLGVMNARAHFYASRNEKLSSFLHEGRVFGPHGRGLVVANSMKNYDPQLSETLTEQTVTANLALREIGFKPYIAPALSSGALSILATLSGDWHYSTIFVGGVYFGCFNRTHHMTQEWELYDLPDQLRSRLEKTYQELGAFSWL